MGMSRRTFTSALGAAGLALLGCSTKAKLSVPSPPPGGSRPFRIRAITAGATLRHVGDHHTLEAAIDFLTAAQTAFEEAGYEVQTVRVATQPLVAELGSADRHRALRELQRLDAVVKAQNVNFSIGPVITDDRLDPDLAPWAADLVRSTANTSFSVTVASAARGVHARSCVSAAQVMNAIAPAVPRGEGNFRFAAAAWCPPGTPFFPVAFHEGDQAVSIGLESASLIREAASRAHSTADATAHIKRLMESELATVEQLARTVADRFERRYLGIDASPAPGLDRSIGEAIEAMTGSPFGAPSTLQACAAITEALKTLAVQTCGYTGLMLPVLEDPVLAQRAAEHRFTVRDLLLYSSVCGTGLDVIPLPGDTPVETLTAVIGDVAALSTKLRKPLSARLLPIPGLAPRQFARFHRPELTDMPVMPVS